MALTMRHPRADEDLTPLLLTASAALRWNLEQVYVADDGTQLVGLVVVFDGGHDLVMVDCVSILPSWAGKGLWWRLLRHVCAQMQAAGKHAVFGYAQSPQAVALAQHNGAKIGTDLYVPIWQEVQDG